MAADLVKAEKEEKPEEEWVEDEIQDGNGIIVDTGDHEEEEAIRPEPGDQEVSRRRELSPRASRERFDYEEDFSKRAGLAPVYPRDGTPPDSPEA